MKLAWNNPDFPEAFSLRRWLRLNILLLALTALVSVSFPVISLSHWLGDSYFRLRGIQPTSPDVALVLIDDAALSQYGRWPWPRTRLAQLLEAVHNSHPRAIGIDVLLPERENENDDMALETAIQQAGNVVLPAKISSSLEGALWTEPLPRFAKAAVAIGHAQAVLDSDGVCRKIPTQEPGADGPRPAFALALAGLATKPVGTQHSETDTGQISGIERIAPSEYLTINYRQQFSPAQAIPPFITLSARDLLQAGNSKALEGKIVLIGFGATELSDRLFTPVSGQEPMPGVEVNANALATLLEHREIKSPAVGLQVLFLWLPELFLSGW
jgi:CHASE2 domain-containing sensor protein